MGVSFLEGILILAPMQYQLRIIPNYIALTAKEDNLVVGLAMGVICLDLVGDFIGHHWLYPLTQNRVLFRLPVQKSYENNSIKSEVVSAYIHNNTAEIYITMKTLLESVF